jgi:lysyl-tRNA synthetase class 2
MSAPETPANDPTDADAVVEVPLDRLRAQRLAKVDAVRQHGYQPYPHRFDRTHVVAQLRSVHGDLEPGAETDHEVAVAGRLMLKREQGRLTFGQLRDRDDQIQLFVSKGVLGAEDFELFNTLDRGDWIGVQGTVMTTKKGELSIKVASFELLSKALRPLPDKWKGLADTETRFRQRYVDLVVNDEARRVFAVRHRAIESIRRSLSERGYLEVETPILQLQQGGGTARPFQAHYNALDLDTYLRIALELPLKRLIVGGLEKVYELGRVFRNEGIDTRHNPEFTMLEAYEAFVDYREMMTLTEDLVASAALAANGTTVVTLRDTEVELAPPWERITMADLIERELGVVVHPSMPVDEARAIAAKVGVAPKEHWGAGKIMAEIYDECVEHRLMGPTIVMDYPREVSPLAKPHRDDPSLVERFEVIVDGRELANAYSELNDPVEQLARFREEAANKAAGDLEAGDVDYDYVRALEYGMPPAGGMGMGIDRLVMVLAGVESIRDVIYFPTLRPEAGFGDADFELPAG